MNTTLTPTENHIAQTKPWKRKYQAYDLDKDRTIYFENPHGKAAKRLYKQYIDYGFEPEMVVPDDLQYYPLSGRFIKKSALEQRGFRITKKTAYKDYIAAFKMANTKNIKAYAGLDLMLRFSDKLAAIAAIKMKKKTIVLNKPIYAGMCILDLSKLHMYRFHYDFIKPKYGDRAKLLFTDTDSLCYHVRTDDFYKDMKTDADKYDMSNFLLASCHEVVLR